MPSKYENSEWFRRGDPIGARNDVFGYQPRQVDPVDIAVPRRRGNRRRIPFVVRLNARIRSLRNIAVVLLALELIWLANTTATFLLKNTDVTGATLKTPKEVAKAANLDKSMLIWRVPVRQAEDTIRRFPEVASVDVSRRWPATVTVKIRERVPAGAVLNGNRCIVIDKDGVAFRNLASPPPGLNIVRLSAPVKAELGKPLPAPAIGSILKCLNLIPESGLGAGTKLVLDQRKCLVGYTADGMVFRLGPVDDAPERLEFLKRLLKGKQGPGLRAKARVIDVSTAGGEVWIPRSEYAATRL